jgi:hypothetical protein
MKYFEKVAKKKKDWRNPAAATAAGVAGYLAVKEPIGKLKTQAAFTEQAKGLQTMSAMFSGKKKDVDKLRQIAETARKAKWKIRGLKSIPLVAAGGVYAAGKGFQKLMDKK